MSSAAGHPRGELDEHADAVPGRPATERVAAILVEQRRAEHVDMRPRSLTRELLMNVAAMIGKPKLFPAVLRRSATVESIRGR